MVTDDTLADDLLEGAKEISTFTGWSERQIYYMVQQTRVADLHP